MRPLLTLLLLIAGSSVLTAQADEELNFDLYGQNEGLSSVWITDLVQDKNGFVWLGTYDGLNRFDGRNFKVYRHRQGDSNSLINNYGQKFYTDARGRIWISYAEGGISAFDPEKQRFQNYQHPALRPKLTLDRDFVVCHVDQHENLWYSGKGMGLQLYNLKNGRHQVFNLPIPQAGFSGIQQASHPNSVYAIHVDETGFFWLSTRNGLYSFEPASGKFSYYEHPTRKAKIRSDDFLRTLPDGRRGLWLAARQGGLSYFDFQTRSFRHFPLQSGKIGHYDLIHEICARNADEFWVASLDRGLGVFNKRNGTYTFKPGLRANRQRNFINVIRILALPDGQFLLGDEIGLFVYNPQSRIFQFKRLGIRESQHGDLFLIRNILEDRTRHEMYFATDMGNGLNILNTQTGSLYNIPVESIPGGDSLMRIRSMLRDQTGKIWLLSRDYLYLFDENSRKLKRIQPPRGSPLFARATAFKSCCTDRNNRLYLLNDAGYVVRLDCNSLQWDTLPGLTPSVMKVQLMQADQSGHLWLAGTSSIAKLSLTNGVLQQILVTGMPQKPGFSIRNLCVDLQGNVWVSVNRTGLLRISQAAQQPLASQWFNTLSGYHLERIVKMNCDTRGNLWMATVTDVLRMNTQTFQVQALREYQGMDYTTLGMDFFKGDYGKFYITTPGKYCTVDFEMLGKKPAIPKVYIDHFSIYNNEIPVAPFATVLPEIRHFERYFAFEFGCIDFNNQQFHQFAYKLEGWDKDWIQSGSRRYAGYTNLEGGNYRLLVKVANGEGVWSAPISIPVRIETPFFRKAWFIALLILLFTLIIYLLYSLRVRAIRRAEALRSRFSRQIAESRMEALRAQMNPHFIFNSLNSINRYIIRNDVKTSSLYLTRFAKLIRSVLDNSRHKVISLSSELEALRMYMEMEAFRFEKKFTYTLQVSDDIDPESIEVPPLIIQPYVENAIWHGLLHKEEEGRLDIQVSKQGQMLCISVCDNGIGRDKAREFKSRNAPTRESAGLMLTGERIRLATGDAATPDPEIIDLRDAAGNAAGTKVIIRIPMDMAGH